MWTVLDKWCIVFSDLWGLQRVWSDSCPCRPASPLYELKGSEISRPTFPGFHLHNGAESVWRLDWNTPASYHLQEETSQRIRGRSWGFWCWSINTASYLLSTVSKYYRRQAQVGPVGVGLGGGGGQFFNCVSIAASHCQTICTLGALLPFCSLTLLKQVFLSFCVFSLCRVGAHFQLFIFNGGLQFCSFTWWIVGPSPCLEGGKTKQPQGGPGAGRKHLAGGCRQQPGRRLTSRHFFHCRFASNWTFS